MVKAQCLWDVAIKMNSSIDSTNVLVANLKPLYWAVWLRKSPLGSIKLVSLVASSHGQSFRISSPAIIEKKLNFLKCFKTGLTMKS